MSGPIVRTGTTPAFWKNWDQAFGGKTADGAGKKKASGGESKAINAFATKKAAKKAAKARCKEGGCKEKEVNPSRLISAESGRPQAESIWACLWSSLFIAALFATVSFVSSPVPGVNEPHYLAKARTFDDPSWCSRDFFLTSSNAHYCFFWLTGILTRFLSLDSIALSGRITSSLLLAIGWTFIGRPLGLTAVYRVVAAGLFATLSLMGSFSGEWLLGGFESKVPAWGFSLMAVSLWIRGQERTCPGWMTAAGVFCGVACAVHPVVGGWVAACICLASVLRLIKVRSGLPKAIIGLTGFAFTTVVVSLPGLLPALKLVLDTSTPQKARELALFYQVFWRLKHHLDPTELAPSQWCYALIMSGGIFLSAMWLRRSGLKPATPTSRDSSPTLRLPSAFVCLLTFFAMSALIALAGVLIGWHVEAAQKMMGWEWRASLLKFYPFRCFDALLPITLALLVARNIQNCFPPTPNSQPWLRTYTDRCCGLTAPAAILFTAVVTIPLLLAWRTQEVAPAGYTADQFADWRKACEWIRLNTPKDALFLTPRESFAFKWFAERAEFVCYKDCPQDAAGILTWNKRLWMLHDWTLKSSSDLNYDEADLRILRRQTECNFLVTRILGPFDTRPIWEGRYWKIYAVP